MTRTFGRKEGKVTDVWSVGILPPARNEARKTWRKSLTPEKSKPQDAY